MDKEKGGRVLMLLSLGVTVAACLAGSYYGPAACLADSYSRPVIVDMPKEEKRRIEEEQRRLWFAVWDSILGLSLPGRGQKLLSLLGFLAKQGKLF